MIYGSRIHPPMHPYLLGILLIVPWTILAIIGVQRGLQNKVRVYNSRFDVCVTVTLCLLLMADVCPDGLSPAGLIWNKAATLLVALPWLWAAKRANRRWRDFCLAVPAKFSLTLAVGMSGAITFLCILKAMSPKTELETALVSGIMTAVGAWVSFRIYKIFFKLLLSTASLPAVGATCQNTDANA